MAGDGIDEADILASLVGLALEFCGGRHGCKP